MHRFSRYFVIAVAAAAIAPAAHAASPFPGWTTTTDDQGLEWLTPDTSAAAPVAQSCEMPTGWIIYTDDQGISWYAPTISSTSGATCPSTSSSAVKVAAKSKKQHKASRHNNNR